MTGHPMQFSKTPATAQPWYSELGQHTAEIMTELGFSADDITAVEAQKNPRQPMSRRGRERAR